MKKSKKIISFLIGIIIIALIGIGINSISKKQVKTLEIKELPEDYKSWLELSDEDKAKTVKPLSFEINAEDKIISKAIKSEIKMFYEKFGNKEVKRLANIIMKEKRENK